MTRATGFLLGSLLMLALFLLALDAGVSPTPVQEVVSSAADAPVQSGVPPAAEVVPVENADDRAGPPVADTARPGAADPPEVDGSALERDPQSWNQSMADYATADRIDATAVSRYLVWSPFRSKWAAEGFAQRLTVATEVPVEVVDAGPGNYQVVFSYRDDTERQAMVERIETVTGLELE
jgi:hypothetical protein